MPLLLARVPEFEVGHTSIKSQALANTPNLPASAGFTLLGMKLLLVLSLLLGSTAFARSGNPETEVRQTLSQFVQTFDNLDWDRFTAFFSDDATMFQPRRFPRRTENKSEIESQFRQVFETIRGSQTRPPYMDLLPRDLRIQMLGKNVALVTFHLDDRPALLNRRTIVWQHFKAGWKIVHIHASEVPLS
jgi:ketosteroid isomerase-like protein